MKFAMPFILILALGVGQDTARAEAPFCGYQCPLSQFGRMMNEFNAVEESGRHTPQACDARLESLLKDQQSTPITAARRLMATLYGSCEVLKEPVRQKLPVSAIPASAVSFLPEKGEFSAEKDLILANHPYLHARVSSSCGDVDVCASKKPEELSACDEAACFSLQHPPVYQFDTRLRDHSTFESVRKGETPSLGMDDSAFISEALAKAGVRIRPDQTVDEVEAHQGGLSNAEFWALGAKDASEKGAGKNQDCFDRVATQPGVASGDLVVGADSHIAMIDTVGNDPFGIQALLHRSYNELQLNLQSVLREKGVARSGLISAYNFQQFMDAKLDDVLKGTSKMDLNLQEQYLDDLAQDACENMLRKPEDYRVTIIHSSPRGGFVGVQREKVFPGLGDPRALSSEGGMFRLKVTADCVQALRADWLSSVSPSNLAIKNALSEESKFVSAVRNFEESSHGVRMLRLNPTYEGCKPVVGEHSFFEASQCVRCCPTDATYDQLVPDEPKEVQR